MIEWLVEPWLHGTWMARTVLAACLVSAACAPVGVLLYLRRQSLLADALSHVALPGIVFAFLLTGTMSTGSMLLGAVATGIGSAWGIDALARSRRVPPDAAIGIVFTALFALGALILSSELRGIHLDLDHALYGNVLGVSDHSLALLGALVPTSWVLAYRFRHALTVLAFDERYAASLGVRTTAIGLATTALASMTAVASFEAVGAVLGVAMFVLPAATAHLVARSVAGMSIAALGVAILSSVAGVYVSIAIDASTSGAIVTCAGALYLLVFLLAPVHGWLPRMAAARRSPPTATRAA